MPVEALLVPDVHRIAVLRANALGDFIFALPALDALRAAYPAAEIVLLGRTWHRELLRDRPSPVDRVVPLPEGLPPDGSMPLRAERERQELETVAAEGWDIALQLHGGGRNSNRVVCALGARVTAGCRTPDAPALDRWIRYVYHQSEVARLLEVVALVGATPVGIEPRLGVTSADREAARAAAPELAPGSYVVLHPGASDPRRRWPPESFAAVGDAVAELGLTVAVTGTDGEEAAARAVIAGMRGPGVNLVGRLSLAALTGLLTDAALVVSNDTGPLHLAGAVGTPTVGIYWCGNAINGGTLLRDRNRLALSWQLACPVCGIDCTRGVCSHTGSFVADVPVADVLEDVRDLLELRSAEPGPAPVQAGGAAGRRQGERRDR